jgi:hypothetical protein
MIAMVRSCASAGGRVASGLRGWGGGRSVVGRKLVAMVVSAALVSACAGDSKSAAPTAGNKVDRSRSALETAVRAYSTAFLGGDSAKAYALLSKRCRQRTAEVAFEKIVTDGAALYGTA